MMIHHCALDEPQCQMRDLRGSLRAGQETEVPERFQQARIIGVSGPMMLTGIEAMSPRVFRQTRSGDEIIQLAVRLALLAFLLYWSFVLVQPFIPMLAWSMVLTIVTVISLLIVIGPVTWLGVGLIEGLQDFAGELGAGNLSIPSPPEGVKDWPIVGTQIYSLWDQASSNLGAALRQVAPHLKPLAGPVLAFAGSDGIGTLKFVLSVALSGFLFIYRPGLVEGIRRMQARVVTQRNEDFVALAGLTIRTVSQGVIGVAVLQSLLAGVGLKLAGVPHAGVLAFAVLVLAILQIGSAIVLLPVIIWIWATRDFAVALPLTIYLLVVGLADNIIKPLLMGRGLSTPMLVIFIGVLGGMIAHGILGLFVGPIILAVAWQLMMAWIREERAETAPPDVAHSGEAAAAES